MPGFKSLKLAFEIRSACIVRRISTSASNYVKSGSLKEPALAVDSKSMDYSRFINEISSARKASPIRELTKLVMSSPEPIIGFGSGLPNPSLFPFKKLSVTMKDGREIPIEGGLLEQALQYGITDGYPKLVAILTDYQKRLHSPPLKESWTVLPTSGSQDGLCKCLEMFMNPGDYIIAEEFVYPGTIAILKPYKARHLKVKGDQDGIRPDSLRSVLSQWNPQEIRNKVHGVPKILYTVPNGSNPVGTSISAERRREIYKIAQEYNLIIIEDDPYYFLEYSETSLPSFLSMDVDGRVLRFDSFSKMLAGGLRLGYITGPQALLQRIVLHMQCSLINVPTVIQIIVCQLLEQWGFEGYMKHSRAVTKFYEEQRNRMNKYAQKWLTGLAEWTVPKAGMFLWIKVLGIEDSMNMVTNIALPKKVACLPGKFCSFDDTPNPYLRTSFSIVSDEEMDQGFQRLAESIKEQLKRM